MTRIFFDHQIFTEQPLGGISRYFKYLMDGIRESEEFDYKLGALYSNNYYIREEPLPLKGKIFSSLVNTPEKLNKRNNSYTKYILRKNHFDIFHATYYNPSFLKYLKKPLVVTIHDMTYEAFPHLFPANDALPFYKRILVERADKIIAISQNTKNELLKYVKVDDQKIEVIHHGISDLPPTYAPVENLPERYILYVGGRFSYKNFYLLAEAFKTLSINDDKLFLVLAGGGELGIAEIEFLRRHKILNKTIQISATDGQLNTLYRNALCFVYPSFMEGFGLPILEAFKNNCPVLLNNCSSLPEVGGEATRYFENLDSLISELSSIVYNQKNRLKLIKLGKEQLNKFPLKTTIAKTIAIYKGLQ